MWKNVVDDHDVLIGAPERKLFVLLIAVVVVVVNKIKIWHSIVYLLFYILLRLTCRKICVNSIWELLTHLSRRRYLHSFFVL